MNVAMLLEMAADGLVGSYKGSKAREVIVTLEEWEKRGKPEGYGPASRTDLEPDDEAGSPPKAPRHLDEKE